MKQLNRLIIENATSGKIDKQVAAKMLKVIHEENSVLTEDIAIIGMSVNLPGAQDLDEFRKMLMEGGTAFREMPAGRKLDIDRYLRYAGVSEEKLNYSKMAYLDEIDKFDEGFFKLSPKEASLMDPNQRLFLQEAWKAIEDAGYGGKCLMGSRTGVFVGFRADDYYDYKNLIMDAEPSSAMRALTGNLASIIAGRLSYLLDLKGPSISVDTSCSSSLAAVHMACLSIQAGESDMAIAGGVRINLVPLDTGDRIGIESSRAEIRAFDESSDGTVVGEGVIAIVLKPLKNALRDRDAIYAVIKGSFINQDGSSIGLTAPNAAAQEDVLVNAWKSAGIDPETIACIETHGTGTKLGDPIEAEGIQRAFRHFTSKKQFCAIGSVKTNIGHLDNAAGIAGLVKAVLMLKNRVLMPMPQFHYPNKKITFETSPIYINQLLTKWEGKNPMRCGVSSFGFSGTNCHVLLEEAPERPADAGTGKTAGAAAGPSAEIFTVSAESENSLIQILKQYEKFFDKKDVPALNVICHTANSGRGHYSHRLAIIATDNTSLRNKVRQILESNLESCGSGVFYHYSGKNPDDGTAEKMRIAAEKIDAVIAGDSSEELLEEICRMYVQGADIPWEKLYKNRSIGRANLPSYMFQKRRHWIQIPYTGHNGPMLYQTGWIPDQSQRIASGFMQGAILVFKSEEPVCNELIQKLRAQGKDVIEISLRKEFKKINDWQYEIGAGRDSYTLLLEDIQREIGQIIHMFAYGNHLPSFSLEDRLDQGINSLFHLVKVLYNREVKTDILVVTHSISRMEGTSRESVPENALPVGLSKAIRNEFSNITCRTMEADSSITAEELLEEISGSPSAMHVAYWNHSRFIECIRALDSSEGNPVEIRENGIYLITGGLGGIGLEIGKYLSSLKRVRLILTGRQSIPEKALWKDIVLEGSDKQLADKLKILMGIEESESEVYCFSGDTANYDDMKRIIGQIHEMGSIAGIIHCAGVAGAGYITNQSTEELKEILRPKVHGIYLLDRMTEKEDMDFMILMSSVVSLTGDIGRGVYTAANAYLDAFSQFRNGKGRRTVSINWPLWENIGMAGKLVSSDGDGIFRAISAPDAVKAFGEAMKTGCERIIIGELNPNLDIESFEKLGIRMDGKLAGMVGQMAARRKKEIYNNEAGAQYNVRLTGRVNDQYSETERLLANIWCEVLGLSEVDIHDNFFEVGGDSILITKVQTLLEKAVPGKTAITDLFAYPSISKLSAFIDERRIEKENKPEAFIGQSHDRHDIAIIGMAVRMPDAEDMHQYWDNLLMGRDSIKDYPAVRQKDCEPLLRFSGTQKGDEAFYKGGFLDEVDKFDFRFFKISAKEASLLDPAQRLFLETAYEALEDAGYGGNSLSGSRTGVFVGYGGWPFYGLQIAVDEPDSRGVSSTGNIASFVASRIAHILDLHGPSMVVDTACSSSMVSVHLACESIRSGTSDCAIAGGVKINLLPIVSAAKIGVESTDYITRTFDERANGTVWGEGAGAILLKPCKDALKDGDHIYAVIKGTAINQDGNSISITAPNVLAQEEVIIRAWEDAGVPPETIRYIEVHGTGTKLGDPIEIDGIKRAFSKFTKKKQFCAVTSVKPNIGHLDSAAGISSLTKAAMIVNYGLIPPMIHLEKPNSKIDFLDSPIYIGSKPEKIEKENYPIRCGVSSFGLSGTNCHIIIEEAPPVLDADILQGNKPCLLTLSAKNKKSLYDYLNRYKVFLDREQRLDLERICYTSQIGREHFQYRIALVAHNLTELREGIQKFISIDMENQECLTGSGCFALKGHIIGLGTEPDQDETTGDIAQELFEGLEKDPCSEKLLGRLARLYVMGAAIDWGRLYRGRSVRKISIPTYPFNRSRCWVSLSAPAAAEYKPAVKFTGSEQTVSLIRELRQTLDKWEIGLQDGSSVKEDLSGDKTVENESVAIQQKADGVTLTGNRDNQYSELETEIAQVWGKVLGCREIGIDEDFFELGGHSILAASMEAVMKSNNMFIESDDIYNYPTIRKMAVYIAENGKYIRGSGCILEKMEPFNDVFFKNCFYNSFFPVIRFFDKSILPVLINEIAVYDERKESPVILDSRYISVEPLDEVMMQVGIQAVRKETSERIEEDIIYAISQGHPVVLWIDCFYESIRSDTYQKLHWPHTLLIYGFDSEKRVFHVMEHKNRESLTYEKTILSYEDTINAYEGYLEQFHKDEQSRDRYTYYEFYNTKCNAAACSDEEAATQCLKNMRSKIEEIEISASYISRFEENFMEIGLDEDLIRQHVNELLERMNGIINGKLVDKYKFNLLFGPEHPLTKALEGITDAWNNIRSGITKYLYTGILRKNSIRNKSAQFQQIAELERKLISVIKTGCKD